MTTKRAYLDDPFRLEFTAQITGMVTLPDGRSGILLAETYFYPTGGGQEHDTGSIGEARVMDVFIDADENIIHVVDREVRAGNLPARVDRSRRFAYMQHHSAQHLLSGAIDQLLGLETMSSKINIDSPTTIDLPTPNLSESALVPSENLANAIICEDRVIKTYTISDTEVSRIPFRRPPKVTGQIRVIEIEGFDYSACGGTHCTRTGMIGIVKVVKVERRGDKTRLYILAGDRALHLFQDYTSILRDAAQQLDTNPHALADAVARQQAALRAARQDLNELETLRLQREAQQLAAGATSTGGIRVVTASWRGRSPQQLRALAGELQNEPKLVALLAGYDGSKLSLAVASAPETGVNAGELIRRMLSGIGGRGGGDAQLAQGGGNMTEEQFAALFANVPAEIRAVRPA